MRLKAFLQKDAFLYAWGRIRKLAADAACAPRIGQGIFPDRQVDDGEKQRIENS